MDEPKKPKPNIIKKSMQTEMDRRLERVREFLIMQEELTPLASFEFHCLMTKLKRKEEEND
jgi:hypothetical protein